MGWTSTNRRKGLTHKAFFADLWDGDRTRVIDAAGVGYTEVYVAHALLDEETGDIREVGAVVVLTHWRSRDPVWTFSWKAIGESSGPCRHRCPQRILEQLTPTDNEEALKWRRRCWERIERRKNRPRFHVGDLVLFDHALYFSETEQHSVLEVAQAGRRLRFRAPLSRMQRFLVRRESLLDTTIIAGPKPQLHGASSELARLISEYGPEDVAAAYATVRECQQMQLYKALADAATAAAEVADLLECAIVAPAFSRRSSGQMALPLEQADC
jgi:hypothetical protein